VKSALDITPSKPQAVSETPTTVPEAVVVQAVDTMQAAEPIAELKDTTTSPDSTADTPGVGYAAIIIIIFFFFFHEFIFI
jgi:hypothetical protein